MNLPTEQAAASYNVYRDGRGRLVFLDPAYTIVNGVQAPGLEGLVDLGTISLDITPPVADEPSE